MARAVLLRLNPAGYGPAYAFGFFCTNHQAPPCAEFLFGVAVVYCNSGGLMTSVVAGIPQVVWSANRGQHVGEGASAELTATGDLVLRSAPGGAVVWSAGTPRCGSRLTAPLTRCSSGSRCARVRASSPTPLLPTGPRAGYT